MVYSLYNTTESSHEMRYKLAGIKPKDGYIIEATIIDKNGEDHEKKHTHNYYILRCFDFYLF